MVQVRGAGAARERQVRLAGADSTALAGELGLIDAGKVGRNSRNC